MIDRILAVALCASISALAATSDVRVAEAARQQNRDAVRTLIAQGADVNASLGDGMTALHWAAFNDDAEMTRMLLKAGANVKATARIGGTTPLAVACTDGNADVVELLLRAGADPNAPNTVTGTTPLMIAAASGSAKAVELLLDHGAVVNAKDTAHGQTALMFAAAEDRGTVIKALTAHGADMKATTTVLSLAGLPRVDDNGNPLPARQPAAKAADGAAAAATGNSSAAKIMGGMTAMLFAARDGRMDAVHALIEAGADVNQASAGDQSGPLVMAINNAHFDVAKYLVEHGANPNLADIDGLEALYATIEAQYAPLSWAPVALTAQEKVSHLELIQVLLAHGADPNARLKTKLWFRPTSHDRSWIRPEGSTPFWRAAQANDVAAMRLLLGGGADPNLPSLQGDTPLIVAAGVGWSHGNFTQTSPEPGAWMASVKYLLGLGADVNAQDIQGYTALHGAAARGDNDMIQLLVAKGARLDVKSKKGLVLTDMATGLIEYNGDSLPLPYPETVALLEKLGAPAPEACAETCGTPAPKKQGAGGEAGGKKK